jgi:hypothetical protein
MRLLVHERSAVTLYLNSKRRASPEQAVSLLREDAEQVVSNILLARSGCSKGDGVEAKLHKQLRAISEAK